MTATGDEQRTNASDFVRCAGSCSSESNSGAGHAVLEGHRWRYTGGLIVWRPALVCSVSIHTAGYTTDRA